MCLWPRLQSSFTYNPYEFGVFLLQALAPAAGVEFRQLHYVILLKTKETVLHY